MFRSNMFHSNRWAVLRRLGRRACSASVILALFLSLGGPVSQCLGEACDGKSIEQLTIELQDADRETRRAAALELGGRGPEAAPALSALLTAADDAEVVVQKSAIWAIGQLGEAGRAGVPALLRICRQDSRISARVAAVQALGAIGPAAEEAIPLLISVAQGGQGERGDQPFLPNRRRQPWNHSVVLRCDALMALARVGRDNPAAKALLTGVARQALQEASPQSAPYFVVIARAAASEKIDHAALLAVLEGGKRLPGASPAQSRIKEAADAALRTLRPAPVAAD